MTEEKSEYGVGFGPDDHVSASEAAGASFGTDVASNAMMQGLGDDAGRMYEKGGSSVFLDSDEDDEEDSEEDSEEE